MGASVLVTECRAGQCLDFTELGGGLELQRPVDTCRRVMQITCKGMDVPARTCAPQTSGLQSSASRRTKRAPFHRSILLEDLGTSYFNFKTKAEML